MLSVTLCRADGVKQPIRIEESATLKEALLLSNLNRKNQNQSFILKSGRMLDLQMSLKDNGIVDGDILTVFDTNPDQVFELPAIKYTSFADRVKEIMQEAIRLNDNAMSRLETQPKAFRTIQKYALSMPTDDDLFAEFSCHTKMNIPRKADKPSTDAIPNIFAQSSQYEEFDDMDMSDLGISFMFDSVEQAGKYFAKHSLSDWTW